MGVVNRAERLSKATEGPPRRPACTRRCRRSVDCGGTVSAGSVAAAAGGPRLEASTNSATGEMDARREDDVVGEMVKSNADAMSRAAT
jgi:hypothetical protein